MKKRVVFDKILDQRNSRKASIIIGPRQVGKTTILKELHRQLGGLFFDVEIFSDYEKVSTYEKFVATLKVNGYHEHQPSFFYVYLDEFHRYPDLSRVIKSVHDHHDNIKIFATGSSSLEIKNAIQESLAGRKNVTYLYPLNFEEFLHFKDRGDIVKQIRRLPDIQKAQDYFHVLTDAEQMLAEFLIFGGYPEVVLSQSVQEKQEVLRSIFDLYIKKDFAEYVKIEKLRNASQLIKVLAVNHGHLVNYAKYGSATAMSIATTKNYITLLEETFILFSLRPYFTNKNKEISKMPKIYFLDNGVRNYFAGGFLDLESRGDAGTLFEGFYIAELVKNGIDPESIKYYRAKNGDEVDIIIDETPLIPIEVKFKKSLSARDFSPLFRFMRNHGLKKGWIVAAGPLGSKNGIGVIDCFRTIREKNSKFQDTRYKLQDTSYTFQD